MESNQARNVTPIIAAKQRIIVFANEKGGSGKSTTAVHTAIALAAAGETVAAIDLDTRQRTMSRYFENREAIQRRRKIDLPTPKYATLDLITEAGLRQEMMRIGGAARYIILDTPGRDDPLTRIAMGLSDLIVTPINDSFVDLDLIGQVDPESFRVKRPSFYAELIWDIRKARAKRDKGEIDWVVLRNRVHQLDTNNMKRVGRALDELQKRVGFRAVPGLSERVIYRELFPKGLTLLDVEHIESFSVSHVAARQELREMVSAFGLMRDETQPKLALA